MSPTKDTTGHCRQPAGDSATGSTGLAGPRAICIYEAVLTAKGETTQNAATAPAAKDQEKYLEEGSDEYIPGTELVLGK